ncbi:methyl-accepting chemotaxis protein [uncultured Mobiluncus sp.]|uniref:methyl-accepting chemotaxis protein n=1 Tax=uncultured Mobiluncus sp. TaxID=293425 RepID=UPI00288ABBE4|nr:methyl-accepting chemotaxis protein [uncultured Mobiluncus sp.]
MTQTNPVNQLGEQDMKNQPNNTTKPEKAYRRTSLMKRLFRGALPGFVGVIILGMAVLITMVQTNHSTTEYLDASTNAETLSLMEAEIFEIGQHQNAYARSVLEGQPDDAQAQQLEAAQGALEQNIQTIIDTTNSDKVLAAAQGLQKSAANLREVIARSTSELQASQGQNSETLNTVLAQTISDMVAQQDQLTPLLKQEVAQSQKDMSDVRLRGLIFQIITVVALVIVAVIIMGKVRRAVTHSVESVETVVKGLAQGDLTRRAVINSNDELADMSRAVNLSNSALQEAFGSAARTSEAVRSESETVADLTTQTAQAAADSAAQADAVAGAAEQVSINVQTVAAGAEEMGSAIREISSNANEAARVAQEATEAAAATTETVEKLGKSSKEIDDVIHTITAIAEQTNLLALNATIEAARAGEAGKGFAVVAGEVKDLAAETAKATDDITGRIAKIQDDTDSAVTAIRRISEIISQINDFQTTIAAAVEEQTATTNEMARSVTEAASGSSTIATNIGQFAGAASQAVEPLNSLAATASDLQSKAADLRAELGKFKYE